MVDVCRKVLAVKASHAIKKYIDVILFPCVNEGLDVFSLILYKNL